MNPFGFPHSEISGSMAVCASPKLIAADRVLHRFPEPRHPPCALACLTSISSRPPPKIRFRVSSCGFLVNCTRIPWLSPFSVAPRLRSLVAGSIAPGTRNPALGTGVKLDGTPGVSLPQGHSQRTPRGFKRSAGTQTGPADPLKGPPAAFPSLPAGGWLLAAFLLPDSLVKDPPAHRLLRRSIRPRPF